MSLYLHEDITPEVIIEAKKAGITGVKSYPAGVTTNSSSGVLSYEPFYPVFAEMEKQNMVLNLHGEVPSTPAGTHISKSKDGAITILNAEPAFLPTFKSLHEKFPKLRIILEHCSTAAALEAVQACGPSVAGTITAHHLSLVIDDWAGDPRRLRTATPFSRLSLVVRVAFFLAPTPRLIPARRRGVRTRLLLVCLRSLMRWAMCWMR
jgi:dihydroorotase